MKKIIMLFITLGLLMGCTPSASPVDVDVEEIAQAIKDEYGADYAPSLDYDETHMVERLGIDPTWVEAFFGQGPLMMLSSDELIIIKATEGNVEKVLTAMQEYHRFLKEESFQYPMNLPRVQNARLVSEGNYVAFILVGKHFQYPTDGTEFDEQEVIDFVRTEFQRGVDVFESFFK